MLCIYAYTPGQSLRLQICNLYNFIFFLYFYFILLFFVVSIAQIQSHLVILKEKKKNNVQARMAIVFALRPASMLQKNACALYQLTQIQFVVWVCEIKATHINTNTVKVFAHINGEQIFWKWKRKRNNAFTQAHVSNYFAHAHLNTYTHRCRKQMISHLLKQI